ncbi:hypothetical protein BG005_006583 [Podila minutissima]|nr:hypothetical protein BG005_006583 [Podila minutissima]
MKAYQVVPNPFPSDTNEGSDNMLAIVRYCRHLLGSPEVSNMDLKHVYVALSRVISTTLIHREMFFAPVLHSIEKEITLRECPVSVSEFLVPVRNRFVASGLDMSYLLRQVKFLQADLAHEEEEQKKDRAQALERQCKDKALEIIRYLTILIQNGIVKRKISEGTCVHIWNFVWTILFGNATGVQVDIGELASEATKADIQVTEQLFGTLTQSGGRKTDTILRVMDTTEGDTSMIEIGVNEHKPKHASNTTLQKQTSKVIRINRSILSRLQTKETIVFLDAHGLSAWIYGMKVHEDVYGCVGPLGEIWLPSSEYEMRVFLGSGALDMLFRYKEHVETFACELFVTEGRDSQVSCLVPTRQHDACRALSWSWMFNC